MPHAGVRYVAGVDPSGGGADAFTLAIVHREDSGRIVHDVIKGRGRVGTLAPDLADVVREYAAVLTRYGCQDVVGDRYAGQWVRQAFRGAGIRYRDVGRDRSGYYLEVEPLFSQGRIDLLDHLPSHGSGARWNDAPERAALTVSITPGAGATTTRTPWP
jgi:hypothetical protein